MQAILGLIIGGRVAPFTVQYFVFHFEAAFAGQAVHITGIRLGGLHALDIRDPAFILAEQFCHLVRLGIPGDRRQKVKRDVVLGVDDVGIFAGILHVINHGVAAAVQFHVGLDGLFNVRVDAHFLGVGKNDIGAKIAGGVHEVVVRCDRFLGTGGVRP